MRKLVAVLALGSIALVACGGSDGSSGLPGDSSSGGGDSELSKLLAKTKAATYKVTYQSGDDDPFTIAQDPPRFAYSSGDSSTFVLADGSAVSCSGTGSDATCTAIPGSGDIITQGLTAAFGSVGALFLTEAGKGIPGLGNIKTDDKTIAGRDAACAKIDGSTLGVLSAAFKGSYSVCIDKETGVMLETTTDDGKGKTSTIKATEFGTPTDADLTPPVTPSTLPSIPTP